MAALIDQIAESDRNNELHRQLRNTKLAQANSINAAHTQVADERQSLTQELARVNELKKEEKGFRKKKEGYFEDWQKKYEQLSGKERQVEERSSQLDRENDRLEKSILTLQSQF